MSGCRDDWYILVTFSGQVGVYLPVYLSIHFTGKNYMKFDMWAALMWSLKWVDIKKQLLRYCICGIIIL